MKIEIDTDDFDILEGFEDYDKEYINHVDKTHRRWGRMSWLYPGDLIIQIGDKSAAAIATAMREEIEKQKEMRRKQ